ncbi:MAG TPA: PP2C family protein-serine/threonine phosphatase [Bacteroidia bacterium]|nr:PP2C family protein-serine/threonine phosphatase [Bacteroidia bacterium]
MLPDNNKTSSAKRLRIADIKLNSLLEITKSINLNASIDVLLEIYRNVLQHKLFIGKLILLRYDNNDWKSMLNYGIQRDHLAATVEHAKKFTDIRDITSIGQESWPKNEKFEIIVPVYHKNSPLAYVFLGDLNEESIGVSPAIKHLPFIQTLTNILVVAIENKKLAKESIRQAVLQREMDLAKEIQSILVPSVLPHTHELDMDAVYLPFHQISGDYYDFIPLDESEFAICIADVSGKGVAAALLMSNFQANLLALIEQTSSLTELIVRLNRKVVQTAKGESFITFFIAKYNRLTQSLHYINAGHYPPLLHMEDTVTLLKSGCPALGMLTEIPNVKEGILTLRPPATLLTYTDGVIEIENDNKEEFGLEKLTDLFTTNVNEHRTAKQLTTSIIDELKEFKDAKEYVDDITLLVCRILK